MVTDPPPKIDIIEAIHISARIADETFREFNGIYCVKVEAPIQGVPRADGKVVVWIVYYRIPNNKRDLEADAKGWYHIWGDGIIEIYEDKTSEVATMPKKIK